MLIAVVGFIWAFFIKEGDIWQYALICIASGIALGADLIFPPSILADQLHLNYSENVASQHYALLIMVAKTALAFASVISLPFLEIIGFIPNADNDAVALLGLSAVYALLPCLFKCIAAALIWRMWLYSNHQGDLK